MKYSLKKLIALVMAIVMVLSLVPASAFAAEEGETQLDGWTVNIAWSTMSRDYTWNATDDSIRQPKIYVTYLIENAVRDYPKNTLKFTVPGIGNAFRGQLVKASDIAAAHSDTEWSYTWDSNQDVYTFTNDFDVKTGETVSGGFEFLWNYDARKNTDGYSTVIDPTFSVGENTIHMPKLTYSFTSLRDNYRVSLHRERISSTKYEDVDKEYTWYYFHSTIEMDYLARGLLRSNYRIWFDLPSSVSATEILAQTSSGTDIPVTVGLDGKAEFYLWTDKSGDVASKTYARYDYFYVGFPTNKLDGQNVTIHANLQRLYNDDEDWMNTSMNEHDDVDDELNFQVQAYRFNYTGLVYGIDKTGPYSYNNWGKSAPIDYKDRLNALNLYKGKVIPFSIYGSANRGYASAISLGDPAMDYGLGMDDFGVLPYGVYDWNDIHWAENGRQWSSQGNTIAGQTYGEIYSPEAIAEREAAEQAAEDAANQETAPLPEGQDWYYDDSHTGTDNGYYPDNSYDPGSQQNPSDSQYSDDWRDYVEWMDPNQIPDGYVPETESAPETEMPPVVESAPETEAAPEAEAPAGSYDAGTNVLYAPARPNVLRSPEQNVDGAIPQENAHDPSYDVTEEPVVTDPPVEIPPVVTSEPYIPQEPVQTETPAVTEPPAEQLPEDNWGGYEDPWFDGMTTPTPYIPPVATIDPNATPEPDVDLMEDPGIMPIDGSTNIGENDKYSMILGDDKLAITLMDGTIKALNDNDYDIAYVTVPSSSTVWNYRVFAAKTQDAPRKDYIEVGNGDTSTSQTFTLADGYKAVFVRFDDIVGSFSKYVTVGVRMHIDWDAAQDSGNPPNHEAHMVNFNYVQALYQRNGVETDDISVSGYAYSGTYGEQLRSRDESLYGKPLFRNYANVYLRSPITTLDTTVTLADIKRNDSGDFDSTMTATGTISADDSGPLESFSLYIEVPEGMQIDFDNKPVTVTGSGNYETGDAATGFADHATIWTKEYEGKTLVVVDFNFSGYPLSIQGPIKVNVSFPINLSYADYVSYGNRYMTSSYLMVHDDGIDKVAGNNIVTDSYDIDGNGRTDDKMARYTTSKDAIDRAEEWREASEKYVQSQFSTGWVTDTVAKVYEATEDEAGQRESLYQYRLDYTVGANTAKNLTFYDHIEQGARVTDEHSVASDIPSQWQGTLVSVDVSQPQGLGGIVTVYYSTDPNAETDYTQSMWTTTAPEDMSTVKSVAIHVDTEMMPNHVLEAGQTAYVVLNMRAPSDRTHLNQNAVNQFTAEYDAYGIDGASLDKHYDIPSEETYVTLRDTVGKIILQKVDADNILRTDDDGTNHYAAITEGKFQIYGPDGSALLQEGGQKLNSLGRIVLTNLAYGQYQWEEVEAPLGYDKLEGKHPFQLDKAVVTIEVSNHRTKGTVTLTKHDAQFNGYSPLAGAKFELYTSSDEQVFTNTENVYATEGASVSTFTTDSQGKIKVSGLPWGSYYFLEVEAPPGYTLREDHVGFTISKSQYDRDTGTINVTVDAYNDEKLASIRLTKTDSTSKKPIPDAVFSLYREKRAGESEDVLIQELLKTNAVGEIQVDDLPFGTYYFVETRNAPGYRMPDASHAKTPSVTLNASTVETVQKIEFTNDRLEGAVRLYKEDDFGQPVEGATYELYYREESKRPDGDYTKIDTQKTNSSSEITKSGLKWGDYYFIETEAPTGYAVSKERLEFTIDKDTVQSEVYVKAMDERAKGSVKLIKVDKTDHEIFLPKAEFDLYSTDGTLLVAGEDYKTDQPDDKIITGNDGTVTVSELKQGNYYFTEKVPPADYSLNTELVRFSITLDNVTSVQELTVEDEKNKATITINKEINEVYDAFGTPTFIFTITGSDGRVYTKSITLSKEQTKGSVSLTVDAAMTYTIQEMNSSRYVLTNITNDENIASSNKDNRIATTNTLSGSASHAEVTFRNEMKQYEKLSDSTNATNMVKSRAKLTGISVIYSGPNPINDATVKGKPGYDANTEAYTFQAGDFTITAYYDDGTTKSITFNQVSLDQPSIVGGGDTGRTIKVFYTENGITVSDSFSVEVTLSYTKRYTVIMDATPGTIIPDGDWITSGETSAVAKLERSGIREGTTIKLPSNEPVQDGYVFKGWVIDNS